MFIFAPSSFVQITLSIFNLFVNCKNLRHLINWLLTWHLVCFCFIWSMCVIFFIFDFRKNNCVIVWKIFIYVLNIKIIFVIIKLSNALITKTFLCTLNYLILIIIAIRDILILFKFFLLLFIMIIKQVMTILLGPI